MNQAQLADWLSERVAGYLNTPRDSIDVETPLPEYGFDSTMSLSLCADLQRELDIEADATIAWDYPTITALSAHLISVRAESGRMYVS
ncbi:acyl carrier protein [Mycobacterium sp. TY814]|uniref:acyl carrier protein n=1 Tax=unclassified Mycobacterium TaxID=2642494 RepID=UPI0027419CCB|nr:acyl carrier protein [Mycobacterium sp. TY814]MDP7720852.1 acyl carrier protein [Mycobacterium sp. TY814]